MVVWYSEVYLAPCEWKPVQGLLLNALSSGSMWFGSVEWRLQVKGASLILKLKTRGSEGLKIFRWSHRASWAYHLGIPNLTDKKEPFPYSTLRPEMTLDPKKYAYIVFEHAPPLPCQNISLTC